GLSDIISLAAGESNQTIDAGLVQPTPEPASISGFVYCDDNDDGVKDAGEVGLNNVTIQLLNAAGVVISTTTTAADGSYSFTGLDAGTYSVVEPTQPAGKNDGKETAGSTGGNTDVNETISQITVNAGENSTDNNFGEVLPPPEPASISGFVYCDDNDDGVKDAGEVGLNGVTIQLLNAAGVVISTTTTAADGSYSFTGLDAGTYSVVEPTQPAGKNDGKETAGSTGGNTDVNETISQITVNAGENSTDNNFGEVLPPPEPASISGFVYCDDNDDGVKDAGEVGLNNVTIQLLNAAGVVISTTTTAADGSYSFTGLDAGTYSVVEPTQPAGKNDGKETAGSTGGNTDVNETISQITVNAGENSTDNNFGEVLPPPEPASISGFVYCDDNDDGVKDAGEVGLNGVTIQLLNAAGVVISTTTTAADGSYSFTGLDAGTYSVVEPTQPAGKNDGKETAGSTGGNTDVNETISQITV
ncbi:SdrD B-like domain-containing protein, partial [Nitrosomonas aestuarii]|uniref:SdrD B-like domain-containing protein n=1 Tax=Nitrosomonas aestuarii TaxID=52441 RepID=UPI002468035C